MALTPPGRPMHTFGYTAVDRNDRYTPPSVPGVASPSSWFEYNRDGDLRKLTRADGDSVVLEYDAAGRLDDIQYRRGTNHFTYGATGHLATVTSPDTVTVTYGYDGPLVTSETWSGAVAGTVTHGYTRDLEVASETVVGDTATFSYDRDGLLVRAGVLGLSRRSDNGLVAGTVAVNVTSAEEQNTHGERSKLTYRHAGNVVFEQVLARDSLGRITRVDENAFGTSTTRRYEYDVAGRLTNVLGAGSGDTLARHLYDPNGNRVWSRRESVGDTATATHDDQDRLLRYQHTRYEWTAAGELLRTITPGTPASPGESGPFAEDTTSYSYDALGNLIEVRLGDGDTIRYKVDGLNRRVSRAVNGEVERRWLYRNGLSAVAELDGSGALLNRYVYGSEGHAPALLRRGTTTYRLITDHLGSVLTPTS